MINEEDVQTFSIFDNKVAILTEKMNQKAIRFIKKLFFLLFFSAGCFAAIITKHNSITTDLMAIGTGALIGFFLFLDFGMKNWIEFDRDTRRCTIYKNISRKKIIKSFAHGEYIFNHHNMGTTPLVRHCVTLHSADDPKAHLWYTYIKGFPYYVTEEEIEAFRVRLVTALENWFNNKPYDKAIISHASQNDIIR